MPAQAVPPMLVVGPSGSGKSSSIKNLPKDKTVILNIERKMLPFKEALQFGKNDIHLKAALEMETELTKQIARNEIDIIVIESLGKYFEMLLAQSKLINKGYDIYNWYNDKIGKLLETLKSAAETKIIICLAIDERVELISPAGTLTTSRRVKVGGKQWEGMIEKEFAIVLFTSVKAQQGKDSEYSFETNNDGTSSAKSPAGMFPKLIPNDLNNVIAEIKKYYGVNDIQHTV